MTFRPLQVQTAFSESGACGGILTETVLRAGPGRANEDEDDEDEDEDGAGAQALGSEDEDGLPLAKAGA